MAALPAAPYKPKYKALVEGAVKIIYRTIYGMVKEMVYSSLELLNQAIRVALEEHNNRLLKNRPFSRRQLFEETERHTLNPLPEHRYELKAPVYCYGDEEQLRQPGRRQALLQRSVSIHWQEGNAALQSESEVEVYHRYERIAYTTETGILLGIPR